MISNRARTLVLIGTWGVVQTVVAFILLLVSYGSVMHRFDTGTPTTIIDELIDVAARAFAFPIVTLVMLFSVRIPGLWGWVPFILNGLLWSSIVVLAVNYRRRRGAAGSS